MKNSNISFLKARIWLIKVINILQVTFVITSFNNLSFAQSSFTLASPTGLSDPYNMGPLTRPSAENAGSPL